jgi:cytochrome c553
MIATSSKTLFSALLFIYCCGALSGNMAAKEETAVEEEAAAEAGELVGSSEAGEERYKKSCINCHGAAGKGVASYPKISGAEISHTTTMLETYRSGTKVGPNSSLMIMMAKPLTDQEIADLAAYLKDATP